jgi:hypothetical protein
MYVYSRTDSLGLFVLATTLIYSDAWNSIRCDVFDCSNFWTWRGTIHMALDYRFSDKFYRVLYGLSCLRQVEKNNNRELTPVA